MNFPAPTILNFLLAEAGTVLITPVMILVDQHRLSRQGRFFRFSL